MTTLDINQRYLAQTWLGRRLRIQTLSKSSSLLSLPSSVCLFLPLSLSLIDKDKANLFGNQGHGWCRQTLLLRAPLRCPFSHYFVFSSQLLHVGGAARDASSEKPHSCHTLALLQYISSSRGHDFASLVITAGISDYHFHGGMYFPCKS